MFDEYRIYDRIKQNRIVAMIRRKKKEQKWPLGELPQNLKTQAKSLRPVPSGAEGTKNAKQTHF